MIVERRPPRNRVRKNNIIREKDWISGHADGGGLAVAPAGRRPVGRPGGDDHKSITDTKFAPIWSGRIDGVPVARERARRVAVVRGLACVVASPAAIAWCRAALRQLSSRRPDRPIGGPLDLDCEIRQDPDDGEIDEALITEILERAGIIAAGARQLRVRRLVRVDDRTNPRLTLTLRPAAATAGLEAGR